MHAMEMHQCNDQANRFVWLIAVTNAVKRLHSDVELMFFFEIQRSKLKKRFKNLST